MSWLDELDPGRISARRLGREAVATWRQARIEGDGRRRALAHVGLRVIQTLAYAAGWMSTR